MTVLQLGSPERGSIICLTRRKPCFFSLPSLFLLPILNKTFYLTTTIYQKPSMCINFFRHLCSCLSTLGAGNLNATSFLIVLKPLNAQGIATGQTVVFSSRVRLLQSMLISVTESDCCGLCSISSRVRLLQSMLISVTESDCCGLCSISSRVRLLQSLLNQ